MPLPLRPGEQIIREGPANHLKGSESHSGTLWITTQRLVFKTFAYNKLSDELTLPLEEIVSAQPFDTLGIMPNGVVVNTRSGKEEKFIVNQRQEWINKLTTRVETSEISRHGAPALTVDQAVQRLELIYRQYPMGIYPESVAGKQVLAMGLALYQAGGKSLIQSVQEQFAAGNSAMAHNLEGLWEEILG